MTKESKNDQNLNKPEVVKYEPSREGPMKGGRNKPPTTPRPGPPPGINIKKK